MSASSLSLSPAAQARSSVASSSAAIKPSPARSALTCVSSTSGSQSAVARVLVESGGYRRRLDLRPELGDQLALPR